MAAVAMNANIRELSAWFRHHEYKQSIDNGHKACYHRCSDAHARCFNSLLSALLFNRIREYVCHMILPAWLFLIYAEK